MKSIYVTYRIDVDCDENKVLDSYDKEFIASLIAERANSHNHTIEGGFKINNVDINNISNKKFECYDDKCSINFIFDDNRYDVMFDSRTVMDDEDIEGQWYYRLDDDIDNFSAILHGEYSEDYGFLIKNSYITFVIDGVEYSTSEFGVERLETIKF